MTPVISLCAILEERSFLQSLGALKCIYPDTNQSPPKMFAMGHMWQQTLETLIPLGIQSVCSCLHPFEP